MQRARILPGTPALLVEGKQKVLAVADLHIGFEAGLAGIHTGKRTPALETAAEISGIIDEHKPDTLVLLGDVKSSIGRISKSEWDGVPAFLEAVSGRCDVVLVPGNHDSGIERLAPDAITLTGPPGLIIEETLFTHGHAMPPESFAHIGRIVMGHAHPSYSEEGSVLDGQRVWVSLMAQKGDIFPSRSGGIEVVIVPSFNGHLGGARRRPGPVSPIMRRISGCRARIATLDGSIIGDESALDRVV